VTPIDRSFGITCLVGAAALLVGCAAAQLHHEGIVAIRKGNVDQGLTELALAVERAPTNPNYRHDYLSARDKQLDHLLATGNAERDAEHWQPAEDLYQRARAIAPQDPRPQDALISLARARTTSADLDQARADIRHGDNDHAKTVVNAVLARDPANAAARQLLAQIQVSQAKERTDNPALDIAPGKSVSLRFADASVRGIFEAIARSSGITIMVDPDIRPDVLTSIVVEQVPAADAINFVMQTSHLRSKVLDSHTILIYPGTPEKIRDYEDLVVKGFYLANADAKRAEALLKGILKADDIFVDEKSNLIVVRGSLEQIQLAEKLVALHDVSEPEVMLEVQVMEINRSRIMDLGISYPNQATLSLNPSSGSSNSATTGSTTLANYKSISPSVISLLIPPTVVNLSRIVTDADLLANPRIRVRNREHAKVLIGEKLPVVTSTATSTGFVSESIQYLDVGLKLDVEPDISLDNNVSINLNLEVSSVINQITTPGGSLAYVIGTRDATTVLELKDGETEILGGLISDNDTRTANNIPGLGDLPVLGRLFSNHNTDHEKSEVMLAITPHIVRAYRPTIADDSQFWSGTANRPSTQPFILHHANVATGPATPAEAPPIAAPPGNASTTATAPVVPEATALDMRWRGPEEVKVGDTFTVALHLKTDGAVHALPIQMTYEPGALDVVQVQEGGFFKSDGSQSLFASTTDPSSGKILVSAGRSGVQGASGEGDVAILTLKARKPGRTSPVTVSAVSPVLADGQTLRPQPPPPYTVLIKE